MEGSVGGTGEGRNGRAGRGGVKEEAVDEVAG